MTSAVFLSAPPVAVTARLPDEDFWPRQLGASNWNVPPLLPLMVMVFAPAGAAAPPDPPAAFEGAADVGAAAGTEAAALDAAALGAALPDAAAVADDEEPEDVEEPEEEQAVRRRAETPRIATGYTRVIRIMGRL
ncbi:hypothetical protein VM95_05880 [Streptomyces rubellomurinus]|uniref:Uncharacterized protein n=1 Tax=Streptomyces rubellomurinus (strain ATCC 31215) TaxID=359131 RepID=A0A0F2TL54_STRR3|nr:hypothetical protein VM95_05880 [Streptomyces rubellomurinus]